jgi:hypothetical protein
VRRTQLYLDNDLWDALHDRARRSGQTVSSLVRDAVRDRYLGNLEQRKAAMQTVVGIWKDRTDLPETEKYVRSLRGGTRLKRAYSK